MDDRTTIAAMCLQGALANETLDMTYEMFAETSVKHADALLLELARTAPPAVESPLRNVKAGDVLFTRHGDRFDVVTASYPLVVIQYVKADGKVEPARAYDLSANPMGMNLASAEILAALAKEGE